MAVSVLSIISLILGILGMCLSCIVIGIIPCIISLILGAIALRDETAYKYPSILAMICSGIGIAMVAVIISQSDEYKRANVATPTEIVQNYTNSKTKTQNISSTGTVLNLDGIWESDSNNEAWMRAMISGNTISIDWIDDNGNSWAVYWIGTYTAPTENASTYSWISERDKTRTDSVLMASNDDSKEFYYSGNTISYNMSIMGTTNTIKLKRISQNVPSGNFAIVEQQPSKSENEVSSANNSAPQSNSNHVIDMDFDSFSIKYASHEVSTDYEGNPCVIIYFDFTNNSDDPISASSIIYCQAYQNGIECDLATISFGTNDYVENASKNVQKGTTIRVGTARSISDRSDVDVIVEEAFSFSDKSDSMIIKLEK